jgi:hypothetical protein
MNGAFMSTYAKYKVWVGIRKEDLPGIDNAFIDSISDTFRGIEVDGLEIVEISMHGETVGIGVIVSELDWDDHISLFNYFGL